MKKRFIPVCILCALLPALSACGKRDYTPYLSEVKSDLFVAQTEEFSVTVACVSREYPYVADGVPAEQTKLLEIVLKDCQNEEDYRVYVSGEKELGGDMSYRSIRDDFFYSESVKSFPKDTLSIRVEWENEVRELAATSVKNERTLSAEEALERAVVAEQTYVDGLYEDNRFQGEFYVRLLRREGNYYYVGIIDRTGKTLSLLIDGESGEVVARRQEG